MNHGSQNREGSRRSVHCRQWPVEATMVPQGLKRRRHALPAVTKNKVTRTNSSDSSDDEESVTHNSPKRGVPEQTGEETSCDPNSDNVRTPAAQVTDRGTPASTITGSGGGSASSGEEDTPSVE